MAPPLLDQPLSTFVMRAPVSCPASTSIGEALATLSREAIGAIVVVDDAQRPIGVFTLRDVLEKVALPGTPQATPVAELMDTRIFTLPASAHGFEAALLMAREGIRYVLLVERARLVGVVSESRLFAAWRGGIGDTSAVIRHATDVAGMASAMGVVRALVDRLLEERMDSESITRVVSALNDLVTQRLIEITGAAQAFDELDACWLAFGSQGRSEQTLATDQDNGILFSNGADAAACRARLLPLALRVNEALDRCGFPLCTGNVMAGNADWCLSLDEWRDRFTRWIDTPDPRALLNATIFFDFRAIRGDPRHVEALRSWLAEYAEGRGAFLLPMARSALDNPPPLGLVRDFVVQSHGDHAGTIDLKINGVQPFVETARIFGLANRVTATNTLERLAALGDAGRLPRGEAAAYAEAFRFLQLLRLRHNAVQRAAGGPLHNHLDPTTLHELDRRMLKEAFRQARNLQSRLKREFGMAPAAFGA